MPVVIMLALLTPMGHFFLGRVDRTSQRAVNLHRKKTQKMGNDFEQFREAYPWLRGAIIVGIAYWIFLLVRLFERNDLEMGDQFSFLIYSVFLFIHVLILAATFITDKIRKGQKVLFVLSVPPLIITGLFILITGLSYLGSFFSDLDGSK